MGSLGQTNSKALQHRAQLRGLHAHCVAMFSFAGSLNFWGVGHHPESGFGTKGALGKSWVSSNSVQCGKLQCGARRDPGMGVQTPVHADQVVT